MTLRIADHSLVPPLSRLQRSVLAGLSAVSTSCEAFMLFSSSLVYKRRRGNE
jgi:hypothetical protein